MFARKHLERVRNVVIQNTIGLEGNRPSNASFVVLLYEDKKEKLGIWRNPSLGMNLKTLILSLALGVLWQLIILLEVRHCGIRLDIDHTLTDGAAAVTFFRLTILANDSNLLLLHGSACLLFHHSFDGIIVLLEGDTLQVGYHHLIVHVLL